MGIMLDRETYASERVKVRGDFNTELPKGIIMSLDLEYPSKGLVWK